ncbi:cob(I)yrinic acid a,c-diamide adenosyltransferase [Alkalibacterium kapii]|uniref:Corrinoid adenosyltransferase n=1 Tax=Alkalibacterium kapii TaxID=426704 RepID=A0A511ARX1_9LACT|nr:cob(I)yrinic acid a,c-diamide adenosyltransferase [Alkalibacterium kapii]GEK90945.1 Cob(I)yrinic acid a,c-diamide adenosyltransferase [Alkalibacterium kapii]
MKVYTGRGDYGNTNLIGGRTVKKTNGRVDAYGNIDELNAHIGLLVSIVDENYRDTERGILTDLYTIQHDLFDIGSILADKENKLAFVFSPSKFKNIEKKIDELTPHLSELKYFILPGGTKPAAQAHVVRTVTRRVERDILAFAEEEPVQENILIYLNRLSDYFFILARYLNKRVGKRETVYTKTGEVFHND